MKMLMFSPCFSRRQTAVGIKTTVTPGGDERGQATAPPAPVPAVGNQTEAVSTAPQPPLPRKPPFCGTPELPEDRLPSPLFCSWSVGHEGFI